MGYGGKYVEQARARELRAQAWTLNEIAAELGVSRERARQVREAGEKKLRADFHVLALWDALLTGARAA